MKQILFLNVLSLLFFSCASVKSDHINRTDIMNKEFVTVGDTLTKDLVLAREQCAGNFFSFCRFPGSDSWFRYSPAIVKLKTSNFIQSYDDTIYFLSRYIIYDSIDKEKINNIFSRYFDSIFDNANSEFNTISFTVQKKFKQQVNNYQRQVKSTFRFNGILSYSLFKIQFKCVYGGKKAILLPSLKKELAESDGFKLCDVYYIVSISNIIPIKTTEFLNNQGG